MTDKILCPYCGAEMKFDFALRSGAISRTFVCLECGANSPKIVRNRLEKSAEELDEETKAAALRRYTPLLKPMTLEGVLWTEGEIYVEYAGEFDTWACRCFINSMTEEVTVHCIEETETLDFSAYNCTWRCWERKPTDEERSAAEWET